MKHLLVFACLLAVGYGLPQEVVEKMKEIVLEFAGECMKEVSATEDDIAPIKAHKLPTTQTGKCFLACIHKKFNFQDKSGKINKASMMVQIEMLKPLDEDLYGKVKQIFETCLTEVREGADECETAYNMVACMARENEKVGIKTFDW